MNNLYRTEKAIAAALRSGNENFILAYENMLTYYSYKDFANKTNHTKIIGLVYNKWKNKYTFNKIAFITNVSESTLLRYRIAYADCFCFYLSHVNKSAYEEIAFAKDK